MDYGCLSVYEDQGDYGYNPIWTHIEFCQPCLILLNSDLPTALHIYSGIQPDYLSILHLCWSPTQLDTICLTKTLLLTREICYIRKTEQLLLTEFIFCAKTILFLILLHSTFLDNMF